MMFSQNEKRLLLVALGIAALLGVTALSSSGAAGMRLLGTLLTALAVVLAAVVTAQFGIRSYAEQKRQDREAELVKRRQQEYERYFNAFTEAHWWSMEAKRARDQMAHHDEVLNDLEREIEEVEAGGGSVNEETKQKHANAERAFEEASKRFEDHRQKIEEVQETYNRAHTLLLPISSDETIRAVNEFHRNYAETAFIDLDPLKVKVAYAKMIRAMRRDAFEETTLSVKEIAQEIPWVVGFEQEKPVDWDKVDQDGKLR